MPNPAEQLAGKTLDGGWRVLEAVSFPSTRTGGVFSQSYMVESEDGTRAFLKALDYYEAFKTRDPSVVLQAMTGAFNFERNLLVKCRDRHMDRVVRGITDGTIRFDDTPSGVVQYLIFELAEGDIRTHLALAAQVELAWCLRCLHHIATGLKQLHSAGIAHQDLKPSNVLVFDNSDSKVADLGCAAYFGHLGPNDDFPCAGDPSYAPPELQYGHIEPDWKARRLGCDIFLLGSMVVFLFTGLSVTSMLKNQLHSSHVWGMWAGSYEDVLPYVRNAFGEVVEQFAAAMSNTRLREELRTIVSELCDPDPRRRGDPAERRGMGSQFSLERYVTKFDLLARRAEMRFFEGK